MRLTDTAIRKVKPGEKPIKMFDDRGLFLLVTPAGGKWWHFKYRFDNKEKLLSLGISLFPISSNTSTSFGNLIT